jgi:hypothetical protein
MNLIFQPYIRCVVTDRSAACPVRHDNPLAFQTVLLKRIVNASSTDFPRPAIRNHKRTVWWIFSFTFADDYGQHVDRARLIDKPSDRQPMPSAALAIKTVAEQLVPVHL